MTSGPINNGSVGPIGKALDDAQSQKQTNAPADGGKFREFLLDNLNRVNEMQHEADSAVEGLITGKETDITQVMGAVEKADVAFQTLMAVRGKLVESYQEILRMRI